MLTIQEEALASSTFSQDRCSLFPQRVQLDSKSAPLALRVGSGEAAPAMRNWTLRQAQDVGAPRPRHLRELRKWHLAG